MGRRQDLSRTRLDSGSCNSDSMARRAFIVLLLAAALVPFQSVFRTDQIRPAPKLALAALAILSAVRPRHGLLVVAALGPFGNLLADADRHR